MSEQRKMIYADDLIEEICEHKGCFGTETGNGMKKALQDALNIDQKWTYEQAANDIERYVLRQEPPAIKAAAMAVVALRKKSEKPPKTNADRIRAMSDEELAVLLSQRGCPCVPGLTNEMCSLHETCKESVEVWLRQPAEK